MNSRRLKNRSYWILIPVAGTILFIILYITAASYYPGGSSADTQSVGFSWIKNYWCNLLNEKAINNQQNTARPIAIASLLVLGLTLSSFWYSFPRLTTTSPRLRQFIQFSGILSMILSMLLLTPIDHDLAINLASFFGLLALLGVLISLYRNARYTLFILSALNLSLIGINNLFYYVSSLISYLPVIQKISFASFLVWICCLCMYAYNNYYSNPPNPTV